MEHNIFGAYQIVKFSSDREEDNSGLSDFSYRAEMYGRLLGFSFKFSFLLFFF